MKLVEIKLERFGHFGGQALALDGGALQLLYGPNEAGKSTLLAAVRALLFGFPRAAYDFRFADSLAIGARLHFSDGADVEMRREKKRGLRALLGEEKLSDESLRRKLGNPAESLFANVFAFSLEELARGGESLRVDGFRAALSGAGVGGRVSPDALSAELKKRADELFVERGKRPINKLVDEIGRDKEALRQALLRGEDYRALENELTEAGARVAELRVALEGARRREALAENVKRALPLRDALRGARVELQQLGPVAPLSETAASSVKARREERARLERKLRELDGKLERARGELAALVEDPEALARRAEIAALVDEHSGFVARREQLEASVEEERRVAAEISRARARLDPPWSGEAIESLPVPRVEEVRRKKSEREKLERRRAEIARERERLGNERARLDEELRRMTVEAAVPSPDELARLRAVRDQLWDTARRAWLEGGLTGGEAAGALFERSSAKQLAREYVEAVAAVDRYADEMRRRSTEVAARTEAAARREECERSLTLAEEQARTAEAALMADDSEWRQLWARCGFLPHSPEAMLEWLADYATLRDHVATQQHSAARRAKLSQAAEAYQGRCTKLCEELASAGGSLEEQVRALAARATRAERDHEARGRLRKQEAEIVREIEAEQKALNAVEAELAALRARAGVSDDDALTEAAEAARRAHELKAEIDRAEREIAQLRGGASEEEFAAALQRWGERALVEGELGEARQARAEMERAHEEANQRVGSAREKLKPLDGTSQAAELSLKLESRRAELRDRATEWAQLALARALLERQVLRFAAQHQPALLAAVSSLFAELTGGRWTRVYQRLDDEGTFVAVRADGGEVTPDALSTGTREQLYLALRLAYVARYCQAHEPLPLVLDDVLVNFDEGRAEGALRALGRFAAASTQVLLLTCHRHLVELAARVLPAAAVRPLPAVV